MGRLEPDKKCRLSVHMGRKTNRNRHLVDRRPLAKSSSTRTLHVKRRMGFSWIQVHCGHFTESSPRKFFKSDFENWLKTKLFLLFPHAFCSNYGSNHTFPSWPYLASRCRRKDWIPNHVAADDGHLHWVLARTSSRIWLGRADAASIDVFYLYDSHYLSVVIRFDFKE